MMVSRITVVSVAMLLAFITFTEGMSLSGPGVELRCRCIKTESRRMVRHIEKVELFPANSHCKDAELIATLKESQQEICLDTNAPWVKKVIAKILANKKI